MSTTLLLAAEADAELIGQDAPSMDEEAFRSIYARVGPSLRAYLLRLSGDPALSDDLLQDTFVRLLQGRVPPTAPADCGLGAICVGRRARSGRGDGVAVLAGGDRRGPAGAAGLGA